MIEQCGSALLDASPRQVVGFTTSSPTRANAIMGAIADKFVLFTQPG
jgi:hypothetical protein